MAEFGSCHRNVSHQARCMVWMRARGFTQDACALSFCTEEQILMKLTLVFVWSTICTAPFGFEKIVVKLPPRPDKRIGSDEMCGIVLRSAKVALEENNIPFEYQLRRRIPTVRKLNLPYTTASDRAWQCKYSTAGLPYRLPERSAVSEDNERKVPVMIHRVRFLVDGTSIGIPTEELLAFPDMARACSGSR